MDGFRVDDAAVSEHASVIDALTGRVRTAAAAGTPLGADAYGVVGRVFAVSAQAAASRSEQSLTQLAGCADRIGEDLRATLHRYREAERRAAALFRTEPEGGQ